MNDEDIRWQRCRHVRRAPAPLVTFPEPPSLSEGEQQGLIKAVEDTVERGWTPRPDLLTSQGDASLLGSRDSLGESFRPGLIAAAETWMLQIQDRNLTRHACVRVTADAIAARSVGREGPCIAHLQIRLDPRLRQEGA